jgi:hypothetical protein
MTLLYAHTKNDSNGAPRPQSEWEPLFSEDCVGLKGEHCPECAALDPQHGHLNKVAYLAGKFAAEIFPAWSDNSKTVLYIPQKLIRLANTTKDHILSFV